MTLEPNARTRPRGAPHAIQERLPLAWNHLAEWLGETITKAACTVEVFDSPPASATFNLSLNGEAITILGGASPTALTVAEAFVAAINASGATVDATDNLDGTFALAPSTGFTSFTVQTDSHAKITPATPTELRQDAAVEASKQIADGYCCNPFELDGWRHALRRGSRYVVASDSEAVNGHAAGAIFVATDDDCDDFTAYEQRVRYLYRWPCGGYMDLPLPLRTGILQLAADVYAAFGSGVGSVSGAVTSEHVGDVSVSYGAAMSGAAALTAAVKSMLTQYRALPGL